VVTLIIVSVLLSITALGTVVSANAGIIPGYGNAQFRAPDKGYLIGWVVDYNLQNLAPRHDYRMDYKIPNERRPVHITTIVADRTGHASRSVKLRENRDLLRAVKNFEAGQGQFVLQRGRLHPRD